MKKFTSGCESSPTNKKSLFLIQSRSQLGKNSHPRGETVRHKLQNQPRCVHTCENYRTFGVKLSVPIHCTAQTFNPDPFTPSEKNSHPGYKIVRPNQNKSIVPNPKAITTGKSNEKITDK